MAIRDYVRSLRLAALPVFLAILANGTKAQETAAPRLAAFVGTYADTPGHPLEIVNGADFFAVQDEAKYPLMPKGVDAFSSMYGPKLSFQRAANGSVTGYEQDGRFHPRVSLAVTPESAALAWPRGQGYDPTQYRYKPPADLHDSIAVGDIASSPLGAETANAIARAILDGTYKDVHSVLLYQDGKLVLEEYFYGYNAQRTHQLRSATKSVVSTLAGIAIDRGALSGADEPVLPAMGYTSYANPDPRKAAITVGNFLSMNSGLDCNDHSSTSPGREEVLDDSPDWVKATLDLRPLMVKRLVHTGSTLRPRSAAEKAVIAQALEAHVWPLLAAGRCKPVIDSTYPLAEAGRAHARMESSGHIGKIVLKW